MKTTLLIIIGALFYINAIAQIDECDVMYESINLPNLPDGFNSSAFYNSFVFITDIDNDSDDDIMVTTKNIFSVPFGGDDFRSIKLYLYENMDGVLSNTPEFLTSFVTEISSFGYIDIEDINFDGLPDVLLTVSGQTFNTGNDLHWISAQMNLGNRQFSNPKSILSIEAKVDDSNFHIKDMDNDGLDDFIFKYRKRTFSDVINVVEIYKNYGENVYENVNTIIVENNNPPSFSLSFPDLDNDGLPEIVRHESTQNQLEIYQNLGNNSFSVSYQPVSNCVYKKLVVDIDNDGDEDLITRASSSRMQILENVGNGQLVAQEITNSSNADIYPSHLIEDINKDGWMDIVYLQNLSVVYLINNQDGTFTDELVYTSPNNFTRGFQLGHINNDEDYDFAFMQYSSSYISSIDRSNLDFATKSINNSDTISLGDWVEFTIEFENIIEEEITNVEIVDTLHSALDLNTLQFVHSSHEDYTTTLFPNSRVLEIKFEGIQLNNDSIGFITFRLKPKSNLDGIVDITNSAFVSVNDCYSSITNEVQTTYSYDQVTSFFPNTKLAEVEVYPNPTVHDCYIVFNQKMDLANTQLILYDNLGKIIDIEHTIHDQQIHLNLSHLNKGVYYLSLSDSNSKQLIYPKKIIVN